MSEPSPAPRRLRRSASSRSSSRRRKAWRCSTARRCRRRSRSVRCSRRSARWRRRSSPARCRSTPVLRATCRSTRASRRCADIADRADAAAVYRTLLEGSEIRASHVHCHRVQDPYSLRCQPQVMGACLDQMRNAASMLMTEANAVSDNPLVFPDTGEILSGGNFHAEPVAFAADNLALAIAEIGALSERRIALLMDTTPVGIAAVPRRGCGRQLRLHDRAGDGRGTRLGEQGARASAQRRFAADIGQSGGPRQHGDRRGAAPRADGRQYVGDRRDRAARGRAGDRIAQAIADVGAAAGCARDCPRSAAFWDRDRAFAPDLARMRASVEAGDFARFVAAMAWRCAERGRARL